MTTTRFPKATESTQQRRKHIVQAATHLISAQGLSALSVRTVAKAAGCSRGLVEHYFGNKAALLVAANDWANSVYLDRVASAVGDHSGLAALEIRLRNLLPYDITILDEWKVRVAFWHQGVTIPSVEESNNRSFFTVYQAILKDLQVAQSRAEIAPCIPVVETSELLLFTVIGLCTSCISDPTLRQPTPLDRRVAMILGFLQSGNAASLQVGDPDTEY